MWILFFFPIPSLKLTAKAPESRPKPNRKGSYSNSNHPFLGAIYVSFREGDFLLSSELLFQHLPVGVPIKP